MIKLNLIAKDVLTEGLTDILYHFTYFPYLINILKENKLRASTSIGSKKEQTLSAGKFFYFCTTRSRSSGFGVGDTCIVLDGRKLAHRYKGFPVDYYKMSTKPSDWRTTSDYILSLVQNENEERIVLNKPIIDDARKYILEIHAYMDGKHYFNTDNMQFVVDECYKYNIDVYYYDNRSYFRYQNKSKAIDINKISLPGDFEDDYDNYKEDDKIETGNESTIDNLRTTPFEIIYLASLLSYKDNENYDKLIKYYSKYKDFKKQFFNRIVVDSDNFVDMPDDSNQLHTYIKLIMSCIQNIRIHRGVDEMHIIQMMINDFKKHKVKTINEYIKLKIRK